jgi:hypothetical protein
MREYETITETTTRKVCTKVICDLCGAIGARKYDETAEWNTGTYEVKETTIAAKDGARYPDSASIETTQFDICLNCFNDKLIPWFKSQGAEPTIGEIEY